MKSNRTNLSKIKNSDEFPEMLIIGVGFQSRGTPFFSEMQSFHWFLWPISSYFSYFKYRTRACLIKCQNICSLLVRSVKSNVTCHFLQRLEHTFKLSKIIKGVIKILSFFEFISRLKIGRHVNFCRYSQQFAISNFKIRKVLSRNSHSRSCLPIPLKYFSSSQESIFKNAWKSR